MELDATRELSRRIDALQTTVMQLSEQNARLAEERERYRALYLEMLELLVQLEHCRGARY